MQRDPHSALDVLTSLSARGVQRPLLLLGGSLRNSEVADPTPQSMVLLFALNPRSVLSCCQVDTSSVNRAVGGKKTEFSPRSVPAAHIPLQKEAPVAPVQGAPLDFLCPARWPLRALPAFTQGVGSLPWQVFQGSLQPMTWACEQMEVSALGGGSAPLTTCY